jgi:protein-tyrosine phosphatase
VIDLHSHILPGVDDGARTVEEARQLGREAVDERVTAIAATPHVRYDLRTSPEEIEWGVAALRADFAAEGIPVEILHGAEVELTLAARLPAEQLAALSIARTGRYVLIEFPYRGWPVGLLPLVSRLESLGMTPILAHPERNPVVQDHPERLEQTVEAGAVVQVTARSLDGRFGLSASTTARKLLALGLVRILASDAHGIHFGHGLAHAARALGDPVLAHYLTTQAPAAVVAGLPLPPLPPLPRRPA